MALNRVSGNPTMVGALAGSLLCRKAAANAFAQHKRSTVTSNIIECLGHRLTLSLNYLPMTPFFLVNQTIARIEYFLGFVGLLRS